MLKNNKNNDNNIDSFDDIQAQITELMGPPPLQTTSSTDNGNSTKVTKKAKPPKEEIEPQAKVIKKNQKKIVESEPVVNNDSLDKAMTIGQAEDIAKDKKQEKAEEDYIEINGEKTDSIYSPKVTHAIEDIESREDRLYEEPQFQDETKIDLKNKKQKFTLSVLWKNKKLRNILLVIFGLILVGLALVPATRYFLLNTVGVRSTVSLKVLDSKSLQPVNDAEVSINGAAGNTNTQGAVIISEVKLGKGQLVVKKRSFATIQDSITIGWGSNPIEEPFHIDPTGTKYSFILKDFLSNKPVEGAKISTADSTAITNKNGLAELKTEPTDKILNIKIEATDYKATEIKIEATDNTTKTFSLVAAQPNVYISNHNGKYDLYMRSVDGKNGTVILPGNGNEVASSLSVLTKPKSNKVAFVSSRDGTKNKDGYLLSNLYIVDTDKKTVSKINGTLSEKIQLIGWSGDRLLFVKISAGPSAAQDGRQRLISYNLSEDKWQELARSDSFNDLILINDKLYYANNGPSAKLYKINIDGSEKKPIIDKEVWAIRQLDNQSLMINTSDKKWFKFNLNDSKLTESLISTEQIQANKQFANSPDSKNVAYIDSRDGKDVLIIKPTAGGSEKVAVKQGLDYPLVWINDKYIIVRVHNYSETASYVLNADGGQLTKIGDETETAQTGRWYYF